MLQYRKTTGEVVWAGDGRYLVLPPASTARIRQELEHRRELWAEFQRRGGPRGVPPAVIRELGIYGGAAGVWVEKSRTGDLTPDGTGVTVSVLHTGSAYSDDLADDGVVYHYPKTNRPAARDRGEIEATKWARRLGLPIFVVTYPRIDTLVRDVHLAWVLDWDDSEKTFLMAFGRDAPAEVETTGNDSELGTDDEQPFSAIDHVDRAPVTSTRRPRRPGFKFDVLKRYGGQCSVCDLAIAEVIDAAHIRTKEEKGSDDPRNGLPMCATHHRAFDAGFFAFEPETLRVQFRNGGPGAPDLRITREDITHLARKPHEEVVRWRWKVFLGS